MDPDDIGEQPQHRDTSDEKCQIQAKEPHVAIVDRPIRAAMGEHPGLGADEVPG